MIEEFDVENETADSDNSTKILVSRHLYVDNLLLARRLIIITIIIIIIISY